MDEGYKQNDDYDSSVGDLGKSKKIEISDNFPDEDGGYAATSGSRETVLTIESRDSSPEAESGFEQIETDGPDAASETVPENPIIEAEIEPETVAFVSDPIGPGGVVGAGAVSAPKANSALAIMRDKKQAVIVAVAAVVLILVIGIVLALVFMGPNKAAVDAVKETTPAAVVVPELGATASLITGVGEYSRDGNQWLPFETATKLKKGDLLRTGQDSRAVLTLEDGSILRLDANTSIKLVSLAEDTVEVLHTVGRLYSRVATSEGEYIVKIEKSIFEATGTAFMTSVDPSKLELQVYDGEVKASDIDMGNVSEGKGYHRMIVGDTSTYEVVDINFDLLAEDEFLKWNITEDEKIADFNDQMGILPMVGQRIEALQAERAAAEAAAEDQAAKETAEKEAAEKAETVKETKEEVSRVRRRGSANLGFFDKVR